MAELEKTKGIEQNAAPKSFASFPMPDEKGGGFQKQLEILKACVITSNQREVPSTLEQIKSTLNNSSNSTTTNILFLKKIGFLVGDKGQFQPTSDAIDYFYNSTENVSEARAAVRRVVENSWFWNSTHVHLQLKGLASRSEIITRLAREANVLPDKRKSSLNSLIEFLLYSELLNENEGNLQLSHIPESKTTKSKSGEILENHNSSNPDTSNSEYIPPVQAEEKTSITVGKYRVNINLNFDKDVSEDQVRRLIRTVLDEIGS